MRTWRIPSGCKSADQLELLEAPKPVPAPGEVLVRVRACSINYRDQAIVRGHYFGGVVTVPAAPLSDGAGVVEAVGSQVAGIRSGDRVAGLFFQNWRDGLPSAQVGPALGAPPAQGMLADYVALPEQGVIKLARSLS